MNSYDLLTLSPGGKPTLALAAQAVEHTISNLKKLMQMGYRNFVLLTLPDFSLAPRFQNQDQTQQSIARITTEFYNLTLHDAIRHLNSSVIATTVIDEMTNKPNSPLDKKDAQNDHMSELQQSFSKQVTREVQSKLGKLVGSDVATANISQLVSETISEYSFSIFDTRELIKHVFDSPAEFGLDPLKLRISLKNSSFYDEKDPTNSQGCAFWDDIHPTTSMHAILAKELFGFIQTRFSLMLGNKTPVQQFRELYHAVKKCRESSSSSIYKVSMFSRSGHFNYSKSNLTLLEILTHGLKNSNSQTNWVIQQLGWVDAHKNLKTADRDVKKAYDTAMISFNSCCGPSAVKEHEENTSVPRIRNLKFQPLIAKFGLMPHHETSGMTSLLSTNSSATEPVLIATAHPS